MVQFIVAILGIYIGLSISFEQLSQKIFQFSRKEITEFQEVRLGRVVKWFAKTEGIVGIIGFLLGIVVLIAPTPTAQVVDIPVPHIQEVTQRFIGDFFPAITLILGSMVLNKGILNFFNFKNRSRVGRFSSFIEKYGFWIGIVTMFFGFLHLILGSSVLF